MQSILATQTYASLTAEQRVAYEKVLLPRALSKLVMFKDADKGSIPANQGLQTEWRLWSSLPLATTPLTEGTAPADSALTVTKVTAVVQQFGAFVKASDLFVHQSIDPVWAQIYGLLGENAGKTLHTVLVSKLAAGPSVRYVAGVANRSLVTASNIVTVTEVRKMVRTLAALDIPRFDDNTYHALIHPRVSFDVMADQAWRNPNEYRGDFGANSITYGELGMLYGVKFIESTDAPVFTGTGGGGIDVYGTIFYGKGFYGIRDLAAAPTATPDARTQKGISVSGVPVETETKDDPLGQFGVAGWKSSFVAVILQSTFGWRLESAVSA